jgi:glucose/mannose-6-phosphate isomerase
VIDLDDDGALSAGDPGGMLGVVASLGAHVREGYERGSRMTPLPSADGITSLCFCGMGSSAVAAEVVRALGRERLGFPVDVSRSATLPAYCGPRTLAVVTSYSGDTAEAIACFREALERGCRTFVVTSGGALERDAAAAGLGVALVPGGLMPRASFGFTTSATLGALEAIGILPRLAPDVAETADELEVLAGKLGPGVTRKHNVAKELAWGIGDRTPVVWGTDGIAAVAAGRWRTQFNENAKIPAWSSALPELDHNEVVGWLPPAGERFFIAALRHEDEPRDVAVRFPPSIEIAREAGAAVEEVWAAGRSPLAKLFSLVIVGDFASVYHGLAHGHDPSPIEAIARLKAALAEAGT